MKKTLERVIAESKIWEGMQKETHAFLLSPDVYRLRIAQKEELTKLGACLYDCLVGLSKMAFIAYEDKIQNQGAWILIRKVFSSGVPKIYTKAQGIFPSHIPRLLKVDFLVDEQGSLKIAEIDGHNKHGLGYATLGKRCREVVHPTAETCVGAVAALSEEIRRLGYRKINFLYADQERFYLPEFKIAQNEFRSNGIDCKLFSETEASEDDLREGLFLDLPFLQERPDLYTSAIDAYRSGKTDFIIPPKPFLGAKGALALLRNDAMDQQLEAILCSFINKSSLESVRSYIPTTHLVGSQLKNSAFVMDDTRNFVLKKSISSGMKGVVFSDDPRFAVSLAAAQSSKLNYVLQEEVRGRVHSFSYYKNGEEFAARSNDWYARVTVHYINRNLGDITVTARQDKSVHGAKDCLLLGTVIE
jgi:hypothetical protein